MWISEALRLHTGVKLRERVVCVLLTLTHALVAFSQSKQNATFVGNVRSFAEKVYCFTSFETLGGLGQVTSGRNLSNT